MVLSLTEYYPLAAARSADIRQLLQLYLIDVLTALGYYDTGQVSTQLLDTIGRSDELFGAEEYCKRVLGVRGRSHIPRELARARADVYIEQIGPWVEGSSVLDLGCGNGLIGKGLRQRYGCDVTFADTIAYADSDVELVRITGDTLPFEDCSFDAVLMITALHHMRNPIGELSDAARLARHRIVVKESVVGVSPGTAERSNEMTHRFERLRYEEQLFYTCFVDWFYNRVLETGIDTPFAFRPTAEWLDVLAKVGDVGAVVNLGIDDFLGALYHVLIVIDLNK
jgi:SAM-dependent methyltransferase